MPHSCASFGDHPLSFALQSRMTHFPLISRFSVVRSFVGHGVGRIFHSAPTILHYKNSEPGVMVAGQTFTIEPMLAMGSAQVRRPPTDVGAAVAFVHHVLLIRPVVVWKVTCSVSCAHTTSLEWL